MKIPAKVPALEIRLDASSDSLLQTQVYEGLRELIVFGGLPRGMRLPSSRLMARSLGVSRNTVLFAYEELAARGWLSGKIGSGTRVARRARCIQLSDPDGLTIQASA